MKYYISQTILKMVEGRLNFREVVITRADSRVGKDSARLQDVKLFKSKLEALGIENLHVNKYEKKRYNKLVREQNKHRKEVKLTVADIAEMTKQAVEADVLARDCEDV
jgi:serine phosphatase RsbU (regulator of sigma subunit)